MDFRDQLETVIRSATKTSTTPTTERVPVRRSKDFFERRRKITDPNVYNWGPFIGHSRQWAARFLSRFEKGAKRMGQDRASAKAYQELSRGNDLPTLVNQWCMIDSDEGGRMPLALRRGAHFVVKILDRYWRRDLRLHLRLLKSRRQGISTAVECAYLMLGNEIPYWKTLALADKDEHTQTLIDIVQFAHEEMRFGVGGKWKRNTSSSKPRLTLNRPLRSRFEYETSGGKNVGRSKGYRALHRSEVAFMGDVLAQDAGLLATIPKHVGFVAIVDESTANGAGGPFHRGWTKGWKQPTKSHFSVFLPWIIDERCYQPVEDHEMELYRWSALDEEERLLVERFGACVEQLAFRRTTIDSDCAGDLDQFHQEFPTTPEEAFLTAGRQVFDRKILLWLGNRLEKIDPIAAGDLQDRPEASHLPKSEDSEPWRKDRAEARVGSTRDAAPAAPTTTGTPQPTP